MEFSQTMNMTVMSLHPSNFSTNRQVLCIALLGAMPLLAAMLIIECCIFRKPFMDIMMRNRFWGVLKVGMAIAMVFFLAQSFEFGRPDTLVSNMAYNMMQEVGKSGATRIEFVCLVIATFAFMLEYVVVVQPEPTATVS